MGTIIEGKVLNVLPTEKISDNYSKKEIIVVVDENSEYPQKLPLYAANKKIELLSNVKSGDFLKFHINIKGKESKGRHFVSLEIWKIEN